MVSSKDLDNVTHSELVQKFGESSRNTARRPTVFVLDSKTYDSFKTMKRNTLKNGLLSICFLSVFCNWAILTDYENNITYAFWVQISVCDTFFFNFHVIVVIGK